MHTDDHKGRKGSAKYLSVRVHGFRVRAYRRAPE